MLPPSWLSAEAPSLSFHYAAPRIAAIALTAYAIAVITQFLLFPSNPSRATAAVCDATVLNPIPCENAQPGNAKSEWDVSGYGDLSIQGYADNFSSNIGQTVRFK